MPPLRAGVIVPMRPGNGQWDQQGLRAAGALPRKRRGAGGFVCDTNAHGLAERRLAERTESGCAMTALRPPRCGACRAVSFTSASASLAPTVGQRATPVHDRVGAQDRTQLLPQEAADVVAVPEVRRRIT